MKYWILIVVIAFLLVRMADGAVEGNVITTYLDWARDNNYTRIIDISQSSLEKGYSFEAEEKNLMIIHNEEEEYRIFTDKIESDKIVFSNLKNLTEVKKGEAKTLEIWDERRIVKENIEIRFIESANGRAKIEIGSYKNNITIGNASYKELFDIETEIPNNKFYESSDLAFIIKLINFGKGPSDLDLEYIILNKNGEELYRGADYETVYTQDTLTKKIENVELPEGNYKLISKISYGKNQTAVSEKEFVIEKFPLYEILLPSVIFITIVLGAAAILKKKLGKN